MPYCALFCALFFFCALFYTCLQTTGDFTNGAKILYERTDLLSNILTLQLIRKKYKYIVPAIYKMYVRVLEYRPTTSSLAHTLAGTI